MRAKRKKSGRLTFSQELQEIVKEKFIPDKIDVAKTVRSIREQKGLKGVELCKRAGDLDPKTLTAVEKGRIRNPSIKTLQSLSRGLQVTVSQLFRQSELSLGSAFYLGSQKGAFQMEFPHWGVKFVSFTPFMSNFFCGKLIIGPRKRFYKDLLRHTAPIFVTTLIGRFEADIEGRKINLKEGDNVFFNGSFDYVFFNPLHRESALWLVTAPSFLKT